MRTLTRRVLNVLQSVEFNFLKLLVVGHGGRGKTSLVRALMRRRHDEQQAPTVGIDVRQWK